MFSKPRTEIRIEGDNVVTYCEPRVVTMRQHQIASSSAIGLGLATSVVGASLSVLALAVKAGAREYLVWALLGVVVSLVGIGLGVWGGVHLSRGLEGEGYVPMDSYSPHSNSSRVDHTY